MKTSIYLIIISTMISSQLSAQNTNSEKIIVKTAMISAPIDHVWWQWTTPQGLKTFFGEGNNMELAVGGPYEIYFSMEAPEGERGSEGCKVLSYIPKKMISFTWNVPPEFPEIRNGGYNPWVVVEFEEQSDNKTLVTLTHVGFLEGGNWGKVHTYFISAWDVVMKWLTESNT